MNKLHPDTIQLLELFRSHLQQNSQDDQNSLVFQTLKDYYYALQEWLNI